MPDYHVILYDGVCGLCHRLTRFVLRSDRRRRFRFASLQSALGARILSSYGRDSGNLDTLYVVCRHGTPTETLLSRSEAVLFILRELGRVWRPLGALLRLLPESLLDRGYRLVARHRYRVFGRYDACPLPPPSEADRFLDGEGADGQALEVPRVFVNP